MAFFQRGRTIGAACLAVVAVLALASPVGAVSPNPSLTPGATDPRVTQADVASTICRRGYTSTVRNVATQTKHKVYVAYGISRAAQRGYVIDHLVPLEVGGANDITNLWPEPKTDAKVKDTLENQMHAAVCAGTVSLAAAQAKFLSLASTATATATSAPPATALPATEAPASAPPVPSQRVVHPGAFCAPEGATGVTTAGTSMVCGPASDGRNRWHAA
jgi:hypothetical protein